MLWFVVICDESFRRVFGDDEEGGDLEVVMVGDWGMGLMVRGRFLVNGK